MKELLDIDMSAIISLISTTFHEILLEIGKHRRKKMIKLKSKELSKPEAKEINVPADHIQWKKMHAETISGLGDKTDSVSPLEKGLREHSKDKIADLINKLMLILKTTFGEDSSLDRFIKRVIHEIIDAVNFLAKLTSAL